MLLNMAYVETDRSKSIFSKIKFYHAYFLNISLNLPEPPRSRCPKLPRIETVNFGYILRPLLLGGDHSHETFCRKQSFKWVSDLGWIKYVQNSQSPCYGVFSHLEWEYYVKKLGGCRDFERSRRDWIAQVTKRNTQVTKLNVIIHFIKPLIECVIFLRKDGKDKSNSLIGKSTFMNII